MRLSPIKHAVHNENRPIRDSPSTVWFGLTRYLKTKFEPGLSNEPPVGHQRRHMNTWKYTIYYYADKLMGSTVRRRWRKACWSATTLLLGNEPVWLIELRKVLMIAEKLGIKRSKQTVNGPLDSLVRGQHPVKRRIGQRCIVVYYERMNRFWQSCFLWLDE